MSKFSIQNIGAAGPFIAAHHNYCTSRVFSTWQYPAILFIITLATYYRVILRGDFISLDDMNLMSRLLNEPPLILKQLFFPEVVVNYYRPIMELSYRLDHFLWLDIPSGYHLTNVLLHCFNVCAVYTIGLLLFSNAFPRPEGPSFLASIFFAVNPLTSESVCWISGRPDLLASAFALSSFAFYLLYRQRKALGYLIFSGLLFLLAVLAKEVALTLAILVAVFEFLYLRRFLPQENPKKSIVGVGCFVLLSAAYLFLFRASGIDARNATVAVGPTGLRPVLLSEQVQTVFASTGFYVKKLFMPYPLNFAIASIHTHAYAWIGGLALVLFVVFGFRTASPYGFFASWVLVTLSPSVAAAVLHIPWVPWAERYLYIPLAGFALGLGSWFYSSQARKTVPGLLAFVALIGVFWASTFQRSGLWTDELKLWEDTVRKSSYAPVFYFYGNALLNQGKEREGIAQMEKAIAGGFGYFPYISLSGVALSKKDYRGAEQSLRKALSDYPERIEVHKYLAELYLRMSYDRKDVRTLYPKALVEYERYLERAKNHDAVLLFKIASLYMTVNQRDKATPLLGRIVQLAPGTRYARSSAHLIEGIRKGNP